MQGLCQRTRDVSSHEGTWSSGTTKDDHLGSQRFNSHFLCQNSSGWWIRRIYKLQIVPSRPFSILRHTQNNKANMFNAIRSTVRTYPCPSFPNSSNFGRQTSLRFRQVTSASGEQTNTNRNMDKPPQNPNEKTGWELNYIICMFFLCIAVSSVESYTKISQ